MALGLGGLLGRYTGARVQPHRPDMMIRRLLCVLVLAIGLRYAQPLWAERARPPGRARRSGSTQSGEGSIGTPTG